MIYGFTEERSGFCSQEIVAHDEGTAKGHFADTTHSWTLSEPLGGNRFAVPIILG
jgi:hypothetical protein